MSANTPSLWNVNSTPGAAAQATATKAAVAGVTHVAKRISFSTATVAATAQTPLNVNLRDGTTGAGTILWSYTIAALGTTSPTFDFDNLNIPGTPGNAMTLEFTFAGVANSLQTVNLQGYDLP